MKHLGQSGPIPPTGASILVAGPAEDSWRVISIWDSGAAAADPDIAKLAAHGRKERYLGQRRLLQIVVSDASLREDLDAGTAADVLYAIGSPETYRLLVVDRGWSGARFERWYGETLARLLLEPPSGKRAL